MTGLVLLNRRTSVVTDDAVDAANIIASIEQCLLDVFGLLATDTWVICGPRSDKICLAAVFARDQI